MALYGPARDIALFRSVNRELINDIVQSEVDIYKLDLSSTNTNIYGESDSKGYMVPVRMAAIIKPQSQSDGYTEFGPDLKQLVKFSFLRDDLKVIDLVIEVGDIIAWNEGCFEVDFIVENKLFMARNPETNKTISDNWGWNAAINVDTHLSRKNRSQLEQTRFGSNEI